MRRRLYVTQKRNDLLSSDFPYVLFYFPHKELETIATTVDFELFEVTMTLYEMQNIIFPNDEEGISEILVILVDEDYLSTVQDLVKFEFDTLFQLDVVTINIPLKEIQQKDDIHALYEGSEGTMFCPYYINEEVILKSVEKCNDNKKIEKSKQGTSSNLN